MPNELIGDLSKTRLFDLVKPLVDGKKSGMVAIEGGNAAEFYIEAGSIVHGKTGETSGEAAIYAIMDLNDGRVTFDWHVSTEERTVTTFTEQLMSHWAEREEEWMKIKRVVPSSGAVFSIVVESGGSDRTILEHQWGVFALCNGMRSVSGVADLLGRSIFDVSKIICEMVDTGLLEQAKADAMLKTPGKETVDASFFVTAEMELKKVVGPIARVIINDTLAAFEESRDMFPKDRVESFIRTVSDQILEQQKREQFLRAVWIEAWAVRQGKIIVDL
jgi:Domain of unknown function (DUF4388)